MTEFIQWSQRYLFDINYALFTQQKRNRYQKDINESVFTFPYGLGIL